MNKELTARVQKLTKKLSQESTQVSGALEIVPEQKQLLEKKGILYTVFDLTSKNLVDPLLVKKIVTDILTDSYYESDNVSPIQSLERAIVDVRDKVKNLSGLKTSSAKAEEFNILVAVLWGNVLYMVQFGKGGSFLVRENNVKSVNSATEGNFSVASGVVKDGDVVFLGTDAFTKKHPIEDLIGGKISVSMHDLDETAAALFLKFEMNTEFTSNEEIDFGLREVKSNVVESKKGKKNRSKKGKIREIKSKVKLGGKNKKIKGKKQEKKQKQESLSSKIPSTIDLAKKIPSKLPKITISSGKTEVGKKRISLTLIIPTLFVIGVAVLGLTSFAGFEKIEGFGKKIFSGRILSFNKDKGAGGKEEDTEDGNDKEDFSVGKGTSYFDDTGGGDIGTENKGDKKNDNEVDTSKDEELKIKRIDPEVFYDIKIIDDGAIPNEIVVLDSEVVVSDTSSGKLFFSSLTTPKFEEKGSFEGAKFLSYFGGDLVFADSSGYKVYEKEIGEKGEVIEQYDGGGLGVIKPYLNFVYSLKDGKIIKNELLDSGLSGSVWAESEDLNGGVSMAIDGNIYVLKQNKLLKYYTGKKENFEIKGLEKPLSEATKVVKTVDFENIYIADTGNNRVLVIDTEGNLVRQYLAKNNKFDDIKSISVSPKEERLFVLSGTRIFEIAL